jgi:hypothetical protein
MTNLLNVSNPDEKIKNILKQAINTRQSKIEQISSQIDSIKKQEEDNIIFSPLYEPPEITPQEVASSIASIIGDVLTGFSEGVQQIKADTDTIQSSQSGGQTDVNKAVDTDANEAVEAVEANEDDEADTNDADTNEANQTSLSASHIKSQADNLTKLINKAAEKATQIADEANYSSLGVDNNTALQHSYSKASELGHTAFKTGLLWTEKFINMIMDLSLDAMGDSDIANASWQELSPELNKKIVLLAGVLKELSENPATKEAVKEIAQAVAITMIEIMKEIEPELNKIADQGIEMMDEVATKSVRGATSTAISVAQAFIAEIPWVGGIVDFIIAMGKGFNALMETYKVFVSRSSQMGVRGAKTLVKTEGTIEKGKDRITGAYDSAMSKIEDSQDREGKEEESKEEESKEEEGKEEENKEEEYKKEEDKKEEDKKEADKKEEDKTEGKEDSPWIEKTNLKGNKYWYNKDTRAVTQTPPPNPNSDSNSSPNTVMKGGAFIPNKNIGNKIIKGGKRLNKSVKLFNKTVPKVKFTHKNKREKRRKSMKKRRKHTKKHMKK